MIERILEQIKNILTSRLDGVRAKIALDSYDVLEKINEAAGEDIVIIDVGEETPVGNYPELGVCQETIEVYVARSFGLAELKEEEFFTRNSYDIPLWKLRDAVRDAIRSANIAGNFETNRLEYHGAKRFETPYNLRAAAFVLTFKITGAIPDRQ